MVQAVLLAVNGESREINTAATASAIAKLLKKTKPPSLVGTYTEVIDGQHGLNLWSWTDGKAGLENKHELPPPYDTTLLFGDIVVTRADGDDLTLDTWNVFYNEAFGGFEDLDEDEEDGAEVEEESEDEEEVGACCLLPSTQYWYLVVSGTYAILFMVSGCQLCC